MSIRYSRYLRLSVFVFAIAASVALFTGCGYHVAGRGDKLPPNIRTIAVPAFDNLTTRYRLTEWMPEALTREFASRTRYQIEAEPAQADAVLRGAILSQQVSPLIFDPSSGRASMVQLFVRMQIRLEDRHTGKILYRNDQMEYRARYEIAVDQRAYFDESDAALERLSVDVARTVVSRIVEDF
ncbi:MAG: LPS assembly lipoprotein LptE [Bryobacterales bacterium]|nr:LPS assembly lipoprotein LptE [Bryobacterales bacterium]